MSNGDHMISSQRNNGQYMESMFNQNNGPLSGEQSLLKPKMDNNILY